MGTQLNERPKATRKSVVPLGLISACLLLDLLAAWLAPTPRQSMVVFGVTLGFFFAQTIFIAVCTVWLPVKPIARLFFGAVATAVIAISIGLHLRSARIEIVFIMATAVVCQWLVYQIPMWSMRWRGWQLLRVEELGDAPTLTSDGKEAQYGIQHIFIWTSIVAIFLGLGKMISHHTGIGTFSRGDVFVFANLVMGNSVLALPTIYAMFVRNRVRVWLIGSIVWVVLWMPILLYSIVLSVPTVNPEEIWMFGLLDLLQILLGAALLYSLRRKGFRLVRVTTKIASSPTLPD